jgi:hypothetical protein
MAFYINELILFYLNLVFLSDLSIAHCRIFTSIAEQDVDHCILYHLLPEEVYSWKRPYYILPYKGSQLLVTEVLMPYALKLIKINIYFFLHKK